MYSRSRYTYITVSSDGSRQQFASNARTNMIEIILLFLGVCGALGAPGTDLDYRKSGNQAEMILPRLPGSENLREKALPLSKLYAREYTSLPGNENLAERSQISHELPGTKNLAEKRIPEVVLQRLAQQPSAE